MIPEMSCPHVFGTGLEFQNAPCTDSTSPFGPVRLPYQTASLLTESHIKHNDRPCSNCTLHKYTVENHFRRTQGLFNRDGILNDSWELLFAMLGVLIVL